MRRLSLSLLFASRRGEGASQRCRRARRPPLRALRATTRADIERLTTKLEQERTIRNQKEQYAALARRIKQYPPREQTRQEIEALEGEIAALEEDGKGIASKLELRSKQFAAFMHSVHDLQLSLSEEESLQQTKAGAMDTS